ncbi:MAG: hypothetical protein ACK5P7_09610, partial [Bdellovibrio sp.]
RSQGDSKSDEWIERPGCLIIFVYINGTVILMNQNNGALTRSKHDSNKSLERNATRATAEANHHILEILGFNKIS